MSASVVSGRLLISQALTLYTTPVVYLYLDRFRLWVMRRRGRDVGLAHGGPIPEPGE